MNEIIALRDGFTPRRSKKKLSSAELSDKTAGGWYGRICGCLLGKPVEGIKKPELDIVLKKSGNFPLTHYIYKESITDEIQESVTFPIKDRAYPKNSGKAPSDDDTNYILIAYETLNRYGRDFRSENVAEVWLTMQTKNAYCTAERIAYKNLVNGYTPPASGEYKNAYREWIGAQIRSDFYGYINPFDIEKASEFAYRDARISHTKNGIYGAMWVAAMISAAYGTDDMKEIIRAGLSQIPATSRLYAAIKKVINNYENGMSYEEFVKDLHSRWNENIPHHWCHVISNAEIVAASLLWGGGNYRKSVCSAVNFGFDTDCNGATVGSIAGIVCELAALPEDFTQEINDTLESTLFGYTSVSVKEFAKKSEKFWFKVKCWGVNYKISQI